MKEILKTIERLQQAHECFLESYPEDVSTPEGKRYCVNNLLRESASIITSLSQRLVVDKDLTPDQVEDIFIIMMCHTAEWMDNYTGRNVDWYERKCTEILEEIKKDGEDNEM